MNDPEDDSPDAFEQGARYIFGEKLLPLSWGRRTALQRLTRDEMSQAELALALIFVCLRTPEELDAMRGDDAKAKARADMSAWADSHNVRPGPSEELLYKTASEIWKEYEEAKFTPETAGGSGRADPKASD